MLSFRTVRVDNVSQVSDEDISHENLEYMHGTGIAISTGRDRMGEKKYHYRHGVQTALGDIEDSVWIALVKKLIEKENGQQLYEHLLEWEKAENTVINRDAEDMIMFALRDYVSKLHKYPITETLVKIGLKSLLEGVYNNQIKIHETKPKIWQRLCLTKANYDLLFKFYATSNSCETLQRLNECDKNVDLEALKSYCDRDSYFNLYSAEKVMSENKFSFKQIVDYLFSVQEERGFI